LDFIEKLKISSGNKKFDGLGRKEEDYNLVMMIIVFPTNAMFDNDGVDFGSEDNEESLQQQDTSIEEYKGYDPHDSLQYIKDIIQDKQYPISILEVGSNGFTIESAISFVKEFIKTSRHHPFNLGFEKVVNDNR